jgi:ABC-2 type transport system permease protein
MVFKAAFKHELLSSLRSKSPQLVVSVFLVLTSISSIIGWLTVRNVTKIYNDIVSQNLTTAPNPFTNVPSLYYMRDSVIYVVLIGSLMAIILGAQASLRDRKSNANELIKTRNVNLVHRILGQLSAIASIIVLLEIVSLLTSFILIWVIQKTPLNIGAIFSLLGYGAVSALLMVALAAIGFTFGTISKSEESSLLYPIVGWAVVTFTIPQIITSTHPVALLNPTPAISTGTGLAQSVINGISPLAVMENFKAIANAILGIDKSLLLSKVDLLSFSVFAVIGVMVSVVISSKTFGRKLDA